MKRQKYPARKVKPLKFFDGTITDSDENNRIPVEAKEHMPKSQTTYHEHRLLTLNDLKQIQREYAGEKDGQTKSKQTEFYVKRDGYSDN